MTRICVLGDSNVWGMDDREAGGWADRLKVWFKNTGKFNEVFNLGVPGQDSSQMVERLKVELNARLKPKHKSNSAILIQSGLNDSQLVDGKPRITQKKFESNIRKILSVATKFSTNVLFVLPGLVDESLTNPLTWDDTKLYNNKRVEEYRNIARSVCEQENVRVVDTAKVMGLKYKSLLADGVHMNEQGHKLVFETVKGLIEGIRFSKSND